MPNQTLSALTAASSLTGTELFYIVQSGADRKLTTSQLSSYIGSPFTPSALGIFDDTNVLLSHVGLSSIAVNTPLTITAGWQGTLSSARLNANVVQTVTNDTNVTGVISSQNLALGWTGTLASSRIATVGSSQITGTISSSQVGLGPFTAGQLVYASSATTADGIAGSVWSSSVNTLSLQTNTLTFASTTGTTEARIDSAGHVTVGGSSAISTFENGITTPFLQVLGTNGDNSAIGQARFAGASQNPTKQLFAKSRGATVGDYTIVQADDSLGLLCFSGSNGASFLAAVQIRTAVDAAPGLGSMPGRFSVETTPTGSVTPVERVRIDNAGNAWLMTATSTTGATPVGAKANINGIAANFAHASYGGI